MKDLIIIANADSIWTKRYIEKVIIPLKLSFKIISNYNIKYKHFYRDKGIIVDTLIQGKIYQHIPYIRAKIAKIKLANILLNPKAKIVNSLFVSTDIIDILSNIKVTSKIVLTYLGSDLFRRDKKYRKKEFAAMNKASKIVVMTEDMRDLVLKNNKSFAEKSFVIDMGDSTINEIDRMRNNLLDCKLKIVGEINARKKIVTIGYNAIPQQQHIKVIEALMNLPTIDKQNVHLIVPLTYGRKNIQYIKDVKSALMKSHFSYTILEKFMNDDEMAELCLATDYFINAQTTDAFSSTMIEHIYAGSIVINADWLKYKPLINWGIKCFTFHEFDEIPKLIFDVKNENIDRNVIKKYCGWDICMDKWEKIYNDEF